MQPKGTLLSGQGGLIDLDSGRQWANRLLETKVNGPWDFPGACLSWEGGVEATGGFEPPNRGFADPRLRPLGYVASDRPAPRTLSYGVLGPVSRNIANAGGFGYPGGTPLPPRSLVGGHLETTISDSAALGLKPYLRTAMLSPEKHRARTPVGSRPISVPLKPDQGGTPE